MDISTSVENRISSASVILENLSPINIDGIAKLRNKFKQEINFLEKCVSTKKIKEEHLTCSNLTHLEAVATQLLKNEKICTSIMNNKILKSETSPPKKICVDLILHGGSAWMKVIARNKKALTLVSNGECSFGQKSIIDQAYEFLECSSQHIHYFKPPTVIFFFANGIEECLAKELANVGIKVQDNTEKPKNAPLGEGQQSQEEVQSEELCMIKDLSIIKEITITRLNLGVTTLIAYVSALTNGGCNQNFESEVLKKHAQWERERPVKPILDKLFEGKELYCCQTAAENFRTILKILGGKGEKERGEKFLQTITIVDDHPTPKLKPGGKIKERSIAIFGTGEYLKAITVTANHAFIRSAMNKGVSFEVFLHESRALTEGKELP